MFFDRLQLRQRERRGQVGHVVLETGLDHFVAAGTADEAAPGVGGHAVQRQHLHLLMQLASRVMTMPPSQVAMFLVG